MSNVSCLTMKHGVQSLSSSHLDESISTAKKFSYLVVNLHFIMELSLCRGDMALGQSSKGLLAVCTLLRPQSYKRCMHKAISYEFASNVGGVL